MKLYNFLDEPEFNALKHRMGADGYGHFVEFDPEHQLTFGERDQLAKGSLNALRYRGSYVYCRIVRWH